jgi:hypothetical protein
VLSYFTAGNDASKRREMNSPATGQKLESCATQYDHQKTQTLFGSMQSTDRQAESSVRWSDLTLRPVVVGLIGAVGHAGLTRSLSGRSAMLGLGIATGTELYQLGKLAYERWRD